MAKTKGGDEAMMADHGEQLTARFCEVWRRNVSEREQETARGTSLPHGEARWTAWFNEEVVNGGV
jgi:hypothetical protein